MTCETLHLRLNGSTRGLIFRELVVSLHGSRGTGPEVGTCSQSGLAVRAVPDSCHDPAWRAVESSPSRRLGGAGSLAIRRPPSSDRERVNYRDANIREEKSSGPRPRARLRTLCAAQNPNRSERFASSQGFELFLTPRSVLALPLCDRRHGPSITTGAPEQFDEPLGRWRQITVIAVGHHQPPMHRRFLDRNLFESELRCAAH